MDCIVHGIAKSQTRLSNFQFTSFELRPDQTFPLALNSTSHYLYLLNTRYYLTLLFINKQQQQKNNYQSVVNQRPLQLGGNQPLPQLNLGRKWQSTPVLLPGKSHGQRSLVGYSLWGRKELNTTEQLHFTSLQLNQFTEVNC